MREVFTAYIDGKTLDEVMAATGCSRGAVSNYLNELERATGCSIVRGKRRALKTDGLQTERENGKRRASIHDFHSFRVTWITIALAGGVPLELVQRVTGHRTVEVVMKHYFRPGKEDFRQAILKAMPKMLGEGEAKTAKEQMRQIIEGTTAKTWKQDKARLLELLEKADHPRWKQHWFARVGASRTSKKRPSAIHQCWLVQRESVHLRNRIHQVVVSVASPEKINAVTDKELVIVCHRWPGGPIQAEFDLSGGAFQQLELKVA
jgi:hypothetical protein